MTTAIVCGSGPAVLAELDRARSIEPSADAIGVNFTGLFLASPRHLVSLHPELLGPLRELRRSADWAHDDPTARPITHSRRAHPGVDQVWKLPPQGRQGTSALFAVWVAFQLGYERVILAGVPMDASPRFYDVCRERAAIAGLPGASSWPHDTWPGDRSAWQEAALTWFEGRVRSMGGWTAELLGAP